MIGQLLEVVGIFLVTLISFFGGFIGYATLRRAAQRKAVNNFIALSKSQRYWKDEQRWRFESARRKEVREMTDKASQARKG
jgi:hypothetical protein